ncbi:hypothetical protein ROZALSC1DRAFT_29837, partial [Rozella allomycis CSF55]
AQLNIQEGEEVPPPSNFFKGVTELAFEQVSIYTNLNSLHLEVEIKRKAVDYEQNIEFILKLIPDTPHPLPFASLFPMKCKFQKDLENLIIPLIWTKENIDATRHVFFLEIEKLPGTEQFISLKRHRTMVTLECDTWISEQARPTSIRTSNLKTQKQQDQVTPNPSPEIIKELDFVPIFISTLFPELSLTTINTLLNDAMSIWSDKKKESLWKTLELNVSFKQFLGWDIPKNYFRQSLEGLIFHHLRVIRLAGIESQNLRNFINSLLEEIHEKELNEKDILDILDKRIEFLENHTVNEMESHFFTEQSLLFDGSMVHFSPVINEHYFCFIEGHGNLALSNHVKLDLPFQIFNSLSTLQNSSSKEEIMELTSKAYSNTAKNCLKIQHENNWSHGVSALTVQFIDSMAIISWSGNVKAAAFVCKSDGISPVFYYIQDSYTKSSPKENTPCLSSGIGFPNMLPRQTAKPNFVFLDIEKYHRDPIIFILGSYGFWKAFEQPNDLCSILSSYYGDIEATFDR